MPTKRSLVYGLVLVILGSAVAEAIHQFVLVKYRAEISIPLNGNLALYNRARTSFTSVEFFDRYAAEHSIDNTAAFQAIRNQFLQARSNPLSFTHVFDVSRSDARDLPTEIVAELAKSSSSKPTSYVEVAAETSTPQQSVAAVTIAANYVRELLLAYELRDVVDTFKADFAVGVQDERGKIIDAQLMIDSSDRRIALLRQIRGQGDSVEELGPTVGTQVQVEGGRYLSIAQQVVGLQSLRADDLDDRTRSEIRLATAQAVSDLAAQMDSTLAQSKGAYGALQKMITDIGSRRTALKEDNIAEQAAVSSVETALVDLKVKFIDAGFVPAEPVVWRQAPLRYLVILLGLAVGFAVWLVGWRLTQVKSTA